MKKLIAEFKTLGFKQFAIEHAEKGIFGIAALIVLVFIAGTSWSRYEKQPEEFLKKVEAGKDAIKNSAWADSEKEKLAPKRPLMESVKDLHSPIAISRYEYSTDWFHPLYPTVLPRSEPKWKVLIDPVVDYGKFIMVELPEQPQAMELATADKPKSKDEPSDDDDDDLTRKKPTDDAARVGANPLAAGQPIAAGLGPNDGPDPRRAGIDGMGPAGFSNNSTKTIVSRGVRFVSVRYLFPLEEQIAEFVKAMNLKTPEAALLVSVLDFELERQVAIPGKDPWAGKWEKVDLQAALDIMNRVDYDTELVDLKFTDATMTAPLPRRGAGAGSWAKYAYHPKLQKLKEEEAAAQRLLMEKAKEEYDKKVKENPLRKKGWNELQHDARAIRQQTSGMMPNMASSMATEMANTTDGPTMAGGFDQRQFQTSLTSFGNQMQQDVLTTTKYLLFRYFDFAVTPGNAYRYRVRLIFQNPNFQRPVEELMDEKVAAGETRTSDWSVPTQPVFVADENRIFLAKAERAKSTDSGLPTASFDVFQWFADSGMNIFAKIEKLQLGQFIGGRPKTEVVRPASMSFKEEEIPIFTGCVLADLSLSQIPDLDATEHADLKVDFKKLKNLGASEKALLVDRFGQLIDLDPKASGDEFSKVQKTMEKQSKAWEDLKRPEAAQGGVDRVLNAAGLTPNADAGVDYQAMMGAGMEGMMGGINPLKKGAAGKTGKKPPKGQGAPRGKSGAGAAGP